MSDLFHEEIPDDFIVHAFAVMAATPRHTYLVLTKRPDRMVKRLSRRGFAENVWGQSSLYGGRYPGDWTWPLPNVQLGVSVENQHFADVRIPLLLGAEAALYWASLEPLLGPVDLSRWLPGHGRADGPTLGWVVVGGESMGPPHRALVEPCSCTEALFGGRRRPVASCLACGGTGYKPSWKALQWVLSIRDQCLAAGVPFYFKQWGGSVKKGGTWGGDLLQGRVWHEYPSLAQGFR
jgi:protein gp37